MVNLEQSILAPKSKLSHKTNINFPPYQNINLTTVESKTNEQRGKTNC